MKFVYLLVTSFYWYDTKSNQKRFLLQIKISKLQFEQEDREDRETNSLCTDTRTELVLTETENTLCIYKFNIALSKNVSSSTRTINGTI